jgi:transcriptional regulator with XRE-family HTH domain
MSARGSRINRGHLSRQPAIRARGTQSVTPPQNDPQLVRPLLVDRFAAAILPFSCKQLAQVAECSPDTVKAWRKRRQKPQLEHLFRIANAFPVIRKFVEMEIGSGANPADPKLLDEIARRAAAYMRKRE